MTRCIITSYGEDGANLRNPKFHTFFWLLGNLDTALQQDEINSQHTFENAQLWLYFPSAAESYESAQYLILTKNT